MVGIKGVDMALDLMRSRHPHPGLSVQIADRILARYFPDAPYGEWLRDCLTDYTYMKIDAWAEHMRRYHPTLLEDSSLVHLDVFAPHLVSRLPHRLQFTHLYHWFRNEKRDSISIAVVGVMEFSLSR